MWRNRIPASVKLVQSVLSNELLALPGEFAIPLITLVIGALVAVFLDANEFHFDDRLKGLSCVLSLDFYLDLLRILTMKYLK